MVTIMIDQQPTSEDDIWQALRDVPDPELPTINLVDLGVIARVELDEAARHARVLLLPTFTGCPAIGMMRDLIRDRLEQLDLRIQVDITREQRWSSDLISAAGRQALGEAGIAPPAPATSG